MKVTKTIPITGVLNGALGRTSGPRLSKAKWPCAFLGLEEVPQLCSERELGPLGSFVQHRTR